MSLVGVIKVLLNGGYISVHHPFMGRSSYDVCSPVNDRGFADCIGHITEYQFNSLLPLLIFFSTIVSESHCVYTLYCLDAALLNYEEVKKMNSVEFHAKEASSDA